MNKTHWEEDWTQLSPPFYNSIEEYQYEERPKTMWQKIKDFIGRLYYLYWHDWLCRQEPFTYQWRRHIKKHHRFWILFGGIITGLSTSGLLWLIFHLLI